jgi:hypothetical protein
MIAVGCFIPFVLLIIGAALGSYLGGVHGGYWGASVGFGAGVLASAVGMMAIYRVRGEG